MAFLATLALTIFVVAALLLVLTATVVGVGRCRAALETWRPRVVSVWPYAGAIAAVAGVRMLSQQYAQRLTWLLDFNLTSVIFALEGDLIGLFQVAASPAVSTYFSFMYLYGYVVLTAFPVIAYFCLPSTDHLKEYLLAFLLNNVVGLVFYALFISFGPRNLGVDFVDPILYDIYPEASHLTGSVNVPINVFPSLHASMAVTVMLLAWRTRRLYPAWWPVAALFASSVVVSTMYLGIHWATDVVAGVVLAAGSVYLAVRHVQGPPVLEGFTREPPGGLERVVGSR